MTERVALVAGGSRGMGRAIAERLGRDGVRLAIAARKPEEAVEAMKGQGLDAHAFAADLAEGDPADCVEAVRERLGRLDILVYVAGANVRKPALELTFEEWRKVQHLNVDVAFLLARAAAPGMIERGWGRIVVIGSVNTFSGGFEDLPLVAYATSKTAVLGMVRSLGKEWARHGVTTNLLCPGYVLTEFTAPIHKDNPALFERISRRIPIGRWAEPEDMAGAAAFLCSEEARYMTGQSLTVDGGYLAD